MAFPSICCCINGCDRKDQSKKQATWRIFSLKELHSATNNFNYDNKLGEGGFGSVYWGQLWDGSQPVIKHVVECQEKLACWFSCNCSFPCSGCRNQGGNVIKHLRVDTQLQSCLS